MMQSKINPIIRAGDNESFGWLIVWWCPKLRFAPWLLLLNLAAVFLLAIRDDQAVIIHGHSVQGIERVVCCCNEDANEMSSDLTLKRRNTIWCQPESAMFCAHLSHFGHAVHLLPRRQFSYRAGDEEMPKPLLVLTLLKIISRYQWYISLSISYIVSIVLSKCK